VGLLAIAAVADVNPQELWRRVSLAGVAAVLGALAAVGALADLHSGSHATRAMLAVDRSASVDAGMRQIQARWINRANPNGCVQPCRVVAFAARALALPPTAVVSSATGATDLERGVEAAVAAASRGGRVVVLSDGEQTIGDATRAAAAARARDVTVDAVPLEDSARRDAALTRLDAPASVHQGDTISLLVTVRSTQISPATLSVALDGGKAASQVIQLHKGENPFTLSYTAARVGWHFFRARVRLANDERPQNDALTASVDVGAPPRVIVASAAANPPIAAILAARGVRATVAPPASLPSVAAGYAAIDAVVLDNVPANLLGKSQVAALGTAVQDGGLGLLTLGGRHAYSLGGYAHSALDRVLPVASLSPGDLQRRHLAVELVLDRSGSMADTAGREGIPKITMAKSAARQTAEFVASHRDELGIVAFDIAPRKVLAMQRVTPGAGTRHVLSRIRGLTADGGTDIYLGLKAGLNQLLASKSPNRHMILLTDGISQPHDYSALLQQLKRHHIAVATVALGTDVDAALLRSISKATGGNTYATKRARDLPKIFVKETRLSAEPIQINGPQQVLPQGSSPVVRSLAGRKLPSLSGNVVTRLRTGAQVDLIARSGNARTEPALAQWGYGTGRVVSWTPGLGAPWATRWISQTALWNDAVRWAARGVPPAPAAATAGVGTSTTLQVDLAAAGPTAETRLTAVLERAGGRGVRVVLDESAPSVYSADIPVLPVGSYELTVALPSALGGPRLLRVDVPYAAEYLPTALGRSTLGQLTEQTGGRLLAPGDPSAITGDYRSLRVPLLGLAIMLFLVSVAARMLARTQLRRS
jgi:Ca-activated chloride channel family protein